MIHNKKDNRQAETVNYRNGKNYFSKRRENNKKIRIRKEFNTMSINWSIPYRGVSCVTC